MSVSVWGSLFVIVMLYAAVTAEDLGHELSVGAGGLFSVFGYKTGSYIRVLHCTPGTSSA
jgi:hypothetical protein